LPATSAKRTPALAIASGRSALVPQTCVELRTLGEVTGEEVSMEQRVDQARGAIPFYRGR
jgi:hypothetical protein